MAGDYDEAERRIAEAKASGARELSLRGLDIDRLPDSLRTLTRLETLDLRGCHEAGGYPGCLVPHGRLCCTKQPTDAMTPAQPDSCHGDHLHDSLRHRLPDKSPYDLQAYKQGGFKCWNC